MRIKMFFLFIIILFVVYITGAPHPECSENVAKSNMQWPFVNIVKACCGLLIYALPDSAMVVLT